MTNSVLIRSALISERQALEVLQLRASLSNPCDREALLANPDAIEVPLEQITAGQVFVAEVAGSLAGFAAILPRADRNSELNALFVEPGMWRRGIGRKLIDHCAEAARTRGASALYVVGNPHAEGFYRACGFKAWGTAQTRFGVGLLLRRLL
jgi:N-acetylglutamate synthase-like GNAT family acetyltransferase